MHFRQKMYMGKNVSTHLPRCQGTSLDAQGFLPIAVPTARAEVLSSFVRFDGKVSVT